MNVSLERGDIRLLIEVIEEVDDSASKKVDQIESKVAKRQDKVDAAEIMLEAGTLKHKGSIKIAEMEVDKDNEYIEKQGALGIGLIQKISETRRLKIILVKILEEQRSNRN